MIFLVFIGLKNLSVRNEVLAMAHNSQKENHMLGIMPEALDKKVCVTSLVIFALLGVSVISTGMLNVFDISGVFKQ